MPTFWEGVRKAAATGVVRATVAAETARRRLELQRRLAEQEGALHAQYGRIGEAVVRAVRAGAPPPAGVSVDLAAITASERAIAELRAALAALEPPGPPGAARPCPRCGAAVPASQRFCGGCGAPLQS